jgi:hypothetical protein
MGLGPVRFFVGAKDERGTVVVHPLSDDEKKSALRDGAVAALREAQRPEVQQLAQTARDVFTALVMTPTWHIQQSPPPAGIGAPNEELWSVTPKVTFEQ